MDSHEKGRHGEMLVQSALKSAFPSARLFSNLIIQANDGLTQIDHVLVTSAGVFVIEVKKYVGDILGAPNATLWKQFIGHHISEFQNPLHQNARHVSALRGRLGICDRHFHSIVVFVGRVQLVRPILANVIATIAAGCPKLIEHIRAFPDQLMKDCEIAQATHQLTRLQAAGFTEANLLRSIQERKAKTRKVVRNDGSAENFALSRAINRGLVRQCPREEPLLQVARWAFRNL